MNSECVHILQISHVELHTTYEDSEVVVELSSSLYHSSIPPCESCVQARCVD